MPEPRRVTHLIIGAGPTGLGAGHRLAELGRDDFLLLERHDYAGGLAASFRDGAGFTWDVGGHVLFSHYEYYDRLVEGLLGAEFLEHQRVAAIRLARTWIPYPFQNNIRYLPKDMRWECVKGLLAAAKKTATPANFREWIEAVFGAGIARLFMLPYNFKVWATPASAMAFQWIGERVSVIDLEGVLEHLLLEQDDIAFGPNNAFRFPLHGGTGEIFRRLALTLGERVVYGCEVASVDAKAKIVTARDGRRFAYERLLNTGPLDRLVLDQLAEVPREDLRDAARALKHNGVYVAGVGVAGLTPDPKCWMYFPEDNAPFYRLTNFHNYSPNNAAKPGHSRAFMAETSFSEHKPEDVARLMDKTVDGLVHAGLLGQSEREAILSRFELVADYGYPVPTLGRDAALKALMPFLESLDIFSRGRFGGWKYEVSNMDHSVMQGVEWAERMVVGEDEKTYLVGKK